MALSVLIPYLYLLAIIAYSFSISTMVIGIRVSIRAIISLKKSGLGLRLKLKLKSRLKLRLRSRLRSGVYILYSCWACKVFLSKTAILSAICCIGCKASTNSLKLWGWCFLGVYMSTALKPVGLVLVRLLFSQRSVVLAVRPV